MKALALHGKQDGPPHIRLHPAWRLFRRWCAHVAMLRMSPQVLLRRMHCKQKALPRTLTSLSQPADTMMGLVVTGEKRTQETQSVCPSGSPIVYLHSPIVFHSLIVLSREPDTICARAGGADALLGLAHTQPTSQTPSAPRRRSNALSDLAHASPRARYFLPRARAQQQQWPLNTLLMPAPWMLRTFLTGKRSDLHGRYMAVLAWQWRPHLPVVH